MLVVRVESNIAVPSDMDSVRVVVSHAGKQLQSLPFPLASGIHKLPLEVGLLSTSGGGSDVAITVSGLHGTSSLVSQDAVTGFIKGKSLVLDMYLAAECEAFDCQDPNKTCTQGQRCIEKTRAAVTLPDFDPHGAPGPDAGTGAAGAPADAGTEVAMDAAGNAGAGGAAGAGGQGVDAAAGGVAGADAATDATNDAVIEAAPEVPACVPKTEDCFNGMDDDCDGMPDCADPDCTPSAVCVPRPSGDVGASVAGAGAPCPPGFAMSATYGSTPQPGGSACTGCQCTSGGRVTGCTSNLTTYTSDADCAAGTNGRAAASITLAYTACTTPDTNTPYVFGAQLSAWQVATTPCVAAGTPVKPTPSFATSTTFCKASRVSDVGKTGCAAGFVCMPKPATGGACVLLADASACPAATKTGQVVYAGLTDTRTCAACSCTLSGASCDALTLQMGSDYSCGVDMADIKGGQRNCTTKQPASGVYTPGYALVGTPNNGTCTPSSSVSGGAVTPTGGHSLCCLP